VLKRLEDYRAVSRDPLGDNKNHMQAPLPVPADFRFGARSTNSSNTAAHCLHFNVKDKSELQEENDLGKSEVLGRRNKLTDRVYGLPSVRSDIPKPDFAHRSVAVMKNYGDEPGTAALLHPQRFQSIGVEDEQFLMTRKEADMRSLLIGAGIDIDEETFRQVWSTCKGEEISIKDFLDAFGRVVIDEAVAKRFGATINHGK
jgi:EF-hand domain-containing family member B